MGCSSRTTRGGALLAEVPASIFLYSRLFLQARALSDATIGVPLCKYRQVCIGQSAVECSGARVARMMNMEQR